MPEQYDVVVIGGGHNGLVAASYMAKAGLKVVVLERRYIVGGAAVSEETFPGFKVSTAAMIGGLLKPRVAKELQLHKFGYRLQSYNPKMMHLFPDGRYLQFWQEPEKTAEQIQKFSHKDARAYQEMERGMDRLASIVKPLELRPPMTLGELEGKFQDPGDIELFRQIMFGTMKDLLDYRFESEEMKATFALQGLTGVAAGPMSPGSAYMMLHYWPEPGVVLGAVPGGMGTITQALARCAQSHGATIHTNAEVARILVKNGKATGVELVDGRTFQAKVVASNADPKRTFLRLLEPDHLEENFRHQVNSLRSEGVVFKINLALGEPPDFVAYPGKTLGPQHLGSFRICPSLEYAERAWDDAKYGRPSKEPYMYCILHSAADPTVAPPGKHYLGVYIQFTPYHLRESTWGKERDAYGRHCIDILAQYAPNIKDAILDYQFLSPEDLESVLGLTHGHMFHLESMAGQLFAFRPLPGWANYRTPIANLYLCGAGTHPGGTVTGAPGHNAAQEVIKDLREGAV